MDERRVSDLPAMGEEGYDPMVTGTIVLAMQARGDEVTEAEGQEVWFAGVHLAGQALVQQGYDPDEVVDYLQANPPAIRFVYDPDDGEVKLEVDFPDHARSN
jgi:hypothetical protein